MYSAGACGFANLSRIRAGYGFGDKHHHIFRKKIAHRLEHTYYCQKSCVFHIGMDHRSLVLVYPGPVAWQLVEVPTILVEQHGTANIVATRNLRYSIDFLVFIAVL